MHATIPKRIIQTAKSPDLSLLERAAVTNLRLLNPDFEYVFFDDAQVEAFIDTEFPQHRPTFDGFRVAIQRYDFFRYLAVYRLGGFYFDTDVLLASGLDDIRQFGCVFPFEELTLHQFLRRQYGMDWEIGNYAFAATAGHPFIAAIIDNCVRALRNPEWAEVMIKSVPRVLRDEFFIYDTTGPGLVSRTLAEYEAGEHPVKVLFPSDVCDPGHWHRFGSYGVHLQSGSWRKPRGFVRRYINRLWESATRKSLLQESIRHGGTRSLQFKRPT